ncbi:DNA cytosine methyltransferase, partial [Saccharothrix sp.]|uniref:DNA cytosine methyltransferase n=1 Tax=Saccharothrix sp. TaxID=1873460 RepID=UPI0028112F0E
MTTTDTTPLIGSLCTGYGGLDLGVLAALGTGRIAWCADNDPHITTILATRMPNVPNLGDLRAVDWRRVPPVDVVTAGFPCLNVKQAGRHTSKRRSYSGPCGVGHDDAPCLRGNFGVQLLDG